VFHVAWGFAGQAPLGRLAARWHWVAWLRQSHALLHVAWGLPVGWALFRHARQGSVSAADASRITSGTGYGCTRMDERPAGALRRVTGGCWCLHSLMCLHRCGAGLSSGFGAGFHVARGLPLRAGVADCIELLVGCIATHVAWGLAARWRPWSCVTGVRSAAVLVHGVLSDVVVVQLGAPD
jgi:hypothetical protein